MAKRISDRRLARLARAEYAEGGRIEIDDHARTSRSEEGVYVAAWVWLDWSEIEVLDDQSDRSGGDDEKTA